MHSLSDLFSLFDTQYDQNQLHHGWIVEGASRSDTSSWVNHVLEVLTGQNTIEWKSHPCVLWIDSEGKHTVDQIRKISHFLEKTSWEGAWRAVIVWDADQMTIQAQNALLKNLEEPPRNTLLILQSSTHRQLLPTLYSRGFVVNINGGAQEISEYDYFLSHWIPAFEDLRTHKKAHLIMALQHWCDQNNIPPLLQGQWVLKSLKKLVEQSDPVHQAYLDYWDKGVQYLIEVEKSQLDMRNLCSKTTAACLFLLNV
jgi:hypothetical protein